MFTNFSNFTNPFCFMPSFNGFCSPFNQAAYFTPAWQPTGWFNPGFQTPSFQTPVNYGFGFNNLWSQGQGMNGQFCAPGCCPEFSYTNGCSTPYGGFVPSFASTPFYGVNGVYGTPWQGYSAQTSTGWNGSCAPMTNPWNYAGTTGSYNGYNGVTPQTVPGGFPVSGGVCRNAA